MQCLLHFNIIRKQIFNYDKVNVLAGLVHRYENGMRDLNTYGIRQYIGNNFTNTVKYDVSEFLEALCAKCEYIRNLVEHQVTSITRCRSCDYTNTITLNNIFISIPVVNLQKKSYDLNDLLKITFPNWCDSKESCKNCIRNDMLFKSEVTLARQILIIHFPFSKDRKVIKTNKCTLRAVPTTKVSIGGQLYKVMNAIFHHGSSSASGHYTSICREGKSDWIEANDAQIRKTHWPRGATDVCILFMEKIK